MKKNQDIAFVLFLLAVCFVFTYPGFAAERPLELNYPEISGSPPLETTKTLLPDYIRYIFIALVSISGIIGLAALIIAGIRYLTSSGKPENLKRARQQILAAFWGIIILLGSSIILTNISPHFFSFQPVKMPGIPSPTELPNAPIYSSPTVDLLTRIEKLAETIKEVPVLINQTASKIKQLTDNCNCQNTQSSCLCTGGGPGSACQPRSCYAGGSFHPCPESKEIEKLQKKIIDQRDVVLYYKNRVLSERNDLIIDIEQFINKKLLWYENKLSAARKELPQLKGSLKELKQREIDSLEEKKSWLEDEKQYKEELGRKLEELADIIAAIAPPAGAMARLSSQCFSNVGTKCVPKCKTGGTYGCHDRVSGCQPEKCSGGNPCPPEIGKELKKINPLPQKIATICEEIISIVKGIEKEKIIKTIL